MKKTLRTMLPLFVIALTLSVSCSDDELIETDDLRIAVQSGSGQTERVGVQLPLELVVRVTDLLDNPQEGIIVDFTTTAAGAYVYPSVTTDSGGLASTPFILGSDAGTQTVTASITDGTTIFTATATALECSEESMVPACGWTGGNIFITTTSSDLLGSAGGSVIIEFDPSSGSHSQVLWTNEEIVDIAFSPRGEMFVALDDRIKKVDPDPVGLSDFYIFGAPAEVEMEPNYGSILTMTTNTTLTGFFCSSSRSYVSSSISPECLAVDPISRDVWYVTGDNPTFTLVRRVWDGRHDFDVVAQSEFINTGTATPRGMCADSTGTLYVLLDGSGADRSIGRLEADGTWTEDFYDLYALSTTGRYGDIAYSNGKLFIIDTWNNRLVMINTDGTLCFTVQSTDFSDDFANGERYGIAAAPIFSCP